jgi:hypothetical protein
MKKLGCGKIGSSCADAGKPQPVRKERSMLDFSLNKSRRHRMLKCAFSIVASFLAACESNRQSESVGEVEESIGIPSTSPASSSSAPLPPGPASSGDDISGSNGDSTDGSSHMFDLLSPPPALPDQTRCPHDSEPNIRFADLATVLLRGNLLVGARDLSILYPIPALAEVMQLVGLDEQTGEGPLLTKADFETLTGSTRVYSYERWRVVAVRTDLCRQLTSSDCQPELRITAQPINQIGGMQTSAIHVSYKLNADEGNSVVAYLLTLHRDSGFAANGSGELSGPHPALVAEGLCGRTATGLKKILREFAKPGKISSVATNLLVEGTGHESRWYDSEYRMNTVTKGRTSTWELKWFTKESGEWIEKSIPVYNKTVQRIRSQWDLWQGYFWDESWEIKVDTDFQAGYIFSHAEQFAQGILHQVNDEIVDAMLALENPDTTVFESTDCLSCHMASSYVRGNRDISTSVRNSVADALRDFSVQPPLSMADVLVPIVNRPPAYRTPDSMSEYQTDRQSSDPGAAMMFAYDGFLPVISQQVVNSSIRAAHEVNSRFSRP